MPNRIHPAAIVLVLAMLPTPVASQTPRDASALDPRLAVADSLYFAGDASAALELLDGVADAGTGVGRAAGYEALWRAARAAVNLGVLAEREGTWRGWYERAQGYAARAVALDPTRSEGPYWDIAAKGRVALRAGAMEASTLAEAVRSGSHALLLENPDHAGAHNALGRLYLQILTRSWATRQLARVLAGRAAVAEATWEKAELHLRRAVELDPAMLLYRVDLLRFYTDRERWGEARETLAAFDALPELHPADPVFRRQAAELSGRIPR